MEERFQAVFDVVRQIPEGMVSTYGQIAALAGRPAAPRWAGLALANLRDPAVPWHRVVGAGGRISLSGSRAATQRQRLEHEGIQFSRAGRIDLDRYGWRPSIRVRQ